jgi:hypothetical protein
VLTRKKTARLEELEQELQDLKAEYAQKVGIAPSRADGEWAGREGSTLAQDEGEREGQEEEEEEEEEEQEEEEEEEEEEEVHMDGQEPGREGGTDSQVEEEEEEEKEKEKETPKNPTKAKKLQREVRSLQTGKSTERTRELRLLQPGESTATMPRRNRSPGRKKKMRRT